MNSIWLKIAGVAVVAIVVIVVAGRFTSDKPVVHIFDAGRVQAGGETQDVL